MKLFRAGDSTRKATIPPPKTPCRKGHSRKDAFGYVYPDGYVRWDCRTCTNERVRRHRAKARA